MEPRLPAPDAAREGVKFRKGEVTFRDKLLSSTDTLGKLASIPVVVQIVNKVNRTPATRKLMDDVLHIHRERELPEYDSERSSAAPRSPTRRSR
jgi:glycerol-3-phosphate dehydrogenase subunit C